MSHKFPKGSDKRVGTWEPCACCERTHCGYTVGAFIELGWCDDHQEVVEEIVETLDRTWVRRRAGVRVGT